MPYPVCLHKTDDLVDITRIMDPVGIWLHWNNKCLGVQRKERQGSW